MLQTLKNRRADARDQGFTLIELMVVVLIIAILLAIAIPTFLGAQNKAKNRAAQSSVRNGLTAAETIYADAGKYGADEAALITALGTAETNIAFQAAGSGGPKAVNVERYTDTGVVFVARAQTNTCYAIYVKKDGADAGTYYGTVAPVANVCTAPAAAPATSGAGAWVKDSDAAGGW